MLSTDIYNLAESFTAVSFKSDYCFVIGPEEAEHFGRTLLDFANRAAALEGQPVPSAEIISFPVHGPHPGPATDPDGTA